MPSASPRLIATVALLASTIACHAHNLAQGESCDASDACASGLTCAQGACRAPCNFNSDCSTRYCSDGLCMPSIQPACDPSACTTPPLCRGSTAQCVNDACVYAVAPDGTACIDGSLVGVCAAGRCLNCLVDTDCDPRNAGYDLCFAGSCLNQHCSFTAIAGCTRTGNGTPCGNTSTCRSGYCVNNRCCESACDGTCQACGNDGKCNVTPSDDSRCGIIDCDGLDTTCRDFRDYDDTTKARCASFATCRTPNSASCQLFTDAAGSTICRGVAGICDQEEYCANGACPSDINLPTGSPCASGPKSTDGVCTDAAQCAGLPSVTYGVRYFIEEPSPGSDRVDAFAVLSLTQSGGGLSMTTLSTGRGVRWNSTSSTGAYCKQLSGTGFAGAISKATVEMVLTVPDANSMPGSLLLGMGSTTNKLQLLVSRNQTGPAGQVVFKAVFADSILNWTTTIGARAVIHLVIDESQAQPSNRVLLYVNGVSLGASADTPGAATSITPAATDALCLGNDPSTDAFTGTLYYAALYLQALAADEITEAAARLTASDAN